MFQLARYSHVAFHFFKSRVMHVVLVSTRALEHHQKKDISTSTKVTTDDKQNSTKQHKHEHRRKRDSN